jgi:hypothetical protein
MTPGPSDDADPDVGWTDDADDWASSPPPRPPGIEALQAAAREAIEATRALLDVAEAMVDDPDVAERLGSIVRTVGSAAARAARTAGAAAGRDTRGEGPDDEDDDGGVEHISVL